MVEYRGTQNTKQRYLENSVLENRTIILLHCAFPEYCKALQTLSNIGNLAVQEITVACNVAKKGEGGQNCGPTGSRSRVGPDWAF